MAKAVSDNNGFIEIKDNKLSKPGVFQYLGSEIGAPKPDHVYNVFRPPSELRDPECAASFKLRPWVIDHKMLGKNYGTDAAEKGVHGVIGENVYYDEQDGWLKGNIKIFSDALEDVIADGKDELSLGFQCVYEFERGNYNGEDYEVVQRKIRGNHLASVDVSRMNVAVMDAAMDRMTVSLNTSGVTKMDGQSKKSKGAEGVGEDDKLTLATVMTALDDLSKVVTAMDEKLKTVGQDQEMDKDKKAKDEDYKDKGEDEDKDEDKDKEKDSMDRGDRLNSMDSDTVNAIIAKAVAPFKEKIAALEKAQEGMDSASLMTEISKRDELAGRLVRYLGAFDHASMTLRDVAKYGVEKLGVPYEDGMETAALTAYLHDRPVSNTLYTQPTGQDGKPAESPVSAYINGGAK